MSNTTTNQNNKMSVIIILLAIVVVSFLAIYFGVIKNQQKSNSAHAITINGVYLIPPKAITDFHLTDNHGKPFTKESLKGHWTLLFFGFTNCGMVCPTTMAALNKSYLLLEKEIPSEKMPQVVMISVDPNRDTVERMNEYVTSFNPHFAGARAEMPEVDVLKKQLHIVAEKMEAENKKSDQYTINHSAEVILINPDAEAQAFLSFPIEPETMLKDYKLILMQSAS